jgi:hypothetical protein
MGEAVTVGNSLFHWRLLIRGTNVRLADGKVSMKTRCSGNEEKKSGGSPMRLNRAAGQQTRAERPSLLYNRYNHRRSRPQSKGDVSRVKMGQDGSCHAGKRGGMERGGKGLSRCVRTCSMFCSCIRLRMKQGMAWNKRGSWGRTKQGLRKRGREAEPIDELSAAPARAVLKPRQGLRPLSTTDAYTY